MNIFYINGVRLVILDHLSLIKKTTETDEKKAQELTTLTKGLMKKYNVKISP